MTDRELACRIRAELPPGALRTHPLRSLLAVPFGVGIAGLSIVLVRAPLPTFAAIVCSIILGNLYVSLFFFGHEAGHGGVSHSRRVRTFLMYLAFTIFILSPHFWHVWHNRVHHGYTNRSGYDPDNFGDLDSWANYPSTNFLLKVGPGSGHWLSAIYLLTWFTVLSQGVLWIKSRRAGGIDSFDSLRRTRAVADSTIMLAIWIALGLYLGWWHSLLVILIPMMTANAIVISYISTNHLLRPQVDHDDVLSSSMSVTTYGWLDRLHFHFSHHIEHHLFPSMSSAQAPLVKTALQRLAGDRYLSPPHWKALMLVFHTPRVYDGNRALVDPQRRRRVSFDDVETALRRGHTRVTTEYFELTSVLDSNVS